MVTVDSVVGAVVVDALVEVLGVVGAWVVVLGVVDAIVDAKNLNTNETYIYMYMLLFTRFKFHNYGIPFSKLRPGMVNSQ